MLRISSTFQRVENPEDVGFKSSIINKAIAALPDIKDDIAKYLAMFDHQAAGKDDKYNFFNNEDENEEYDAIVEHKLVCYKAI
jgi:DNA mismatch repair protein MSH3